MAGKLNKDKPLQNDLSQLINLRDEGNYLGGVLRTILEETGASPPMAQSALKNVRQGNLNPALLIMRNFKNELGVLRTRELSKYRVEHTHMSTALYELLRRSPRSNPNLTDNYVTEILSGDYTSVDYLFPDNAVEGEIKVHMGGREGGKSFLMGVSKDKILEEFKKLFPDADTIGPTKSHTYREKGKEVEAHQWFKNGDHPLDISMPILGSVEGFNDDFKTEGKLVRRYRRPAMPKFCQDCGQPLHDHGFLDIPVGGSDPEEFCKVCPSDWILDLGHGKYRRVSNIVFEAQYEPAQ